jgi:hypothetical protein
MEGPVPPHVRAFLREHIKSHEELEILLLVYRQLDRDCTANAVAAELGMNPTIAREALESLCRENLLRSRASGSSVFFDMREQPIGIRNLVKDVADVFQQHRFDIVALLATHAIERVRTRALKVFSDSFLIGRNKDRNG